MGFRVLLIAVHGKEPERIHQEYGVVATGRFEETPDSPLVGTQLPNGSYLLYINDEIEPDPNLYAKLSHQAVLNSCYVNETVMVSHAEAWIDGVKQWSVHHDAQQGRQHLEISGQAPSTLQSIREQLSAQQEGCQDVDYIFDIPVELFAAQGGIRYDQDIPGTGPEPWQILECPTKPTGFWRRLGGLFRA